MFSKKYFNIFACLILFALVSIAETVPERAVMKIGNYEFLHQSKDSIFVARLLESIQDPLDQIESFFDLQPSSRVSVYLTRSEKEYQHFARIGVPEWSQAVAIPSQNLIVLKVDKAEDIVEAPRVLLHEMVHLFFAEKIPGRRVPVWLNEGVADYLSGERIELRQKVMLSEALLQKKLLELNSLDTLLDFHRSKAGLAYTQALSAVEYFVLTFGEDRLQELLFALSVERSFNLAFTKVTGIEFIDFEVGWYEYVNDNYRWLIVLNFDNLLWITMGLLAVLAIVVIRFRNRRKLKSWDQQELEEHAEPEI